MLQIQKLKEILLEAGEIVRANFHEGGSVTRKADRSPLTETDVAVNQLLLKRLSQLLPEAGWLSEESSDSSERLKKEYVWIVDPLDGTREFVRQIPELAISVGLWRSGHIIAGGVYNPISNEGAVSIGDKVESWGFKTVHLAKKQSLLECTVSVSRSEFEKGEVQKAFPIFKEAKPVGSVAYKLLRVAMGAEDLTFTVQPKSEWDLAGGTALLNARGLTCLRSDLQPLLMNQATPRILCWSGAGDEALLKELFMRLSECLEK